MLTYAHVCVRMLTYAELKQNGHANPRVHGTRERGWEGGGREGGRVSSSFDNRGILDGIQALQACLCVCACACACACACMYMYVCVHTHTHVYIYIVYLYVYIYILYKNIHIYSLYIIYIYLFITCTNGVQDDTPDAYDDHDDQDATSLFSSGLFSSGHMSLFIHLKCFSLGSLVWFIRTYIHTYILQALQ